MATPRQPTPVNLDISVALCTRNGAKYLPDQIRSICTQVPPPREIVLSDDGSTDGSVAIVLDTIEACGMKDRIALEVFSNEKPLGVTRNFEQAVRACRCAFVALCDQDDVWHPGRLARMVGEFQARPELLLLHTNAQLVDSQLRPLGLTLFEALEVRPFELTAIARGDAFYALLRRNLATDATTVFRKTLLDAALPFPAEWLHDEWLAAIASAVGQVDVLEEATIDYRQHANNQIGARRMTLLDKARLAFAEPDAKQEQLLRRAQCLLQRMRELADKVPPAYLEAQIGKVSHQQFRVALPVARLLRLRPILVEAARGRYRRFRRSGFAIVQDLLERR